MSYDFRLVDSVVELKLDKQTLNAINNAPSKVMYEMARKTLDMSYIHVPMSAIPGHAGTLRRTTMANGVRGSNKDWYISSTTNYASRVWNLPDKTTHWTTPDTHSKWFEWSLKQYQAQIIDSSISKVRKDSNL